MAKFFPEELIQEVIAANDLADVVSSYVRLGRSGSGLSGLCPFHREKTPSFHVSPDKQLYHCFGCGKGGTVLNFIMEMENLDFVDAVKFLADRAGIRLPEPENAAQSAEFYQKKQKMLAMNRDAARFFYSQVQTPKAVEYLKSRGLSGKTVKHFGIGYTPGGDALTRHLEGLGYDRAMMASAGLSAVNDKGRYYDRFRDRLMFPIIDVRQNIIGFGGRILGEGQPKYLNSPQSPVFDKGKNLYALSFAKAEPSKRLILAEGYMDVVSLHQAGFIGAIASLGTALTSDQARLIASYAKEVVICYDTDAAGVKATARALEIFAKTNLSVFVLTLPDGKDPDEFIKNNSPEAFSLALKKAKPALKYQLDMARKPYNLDDMNDKVAFAREAASILAKVESEIERDAYLKSIADESGISPDAICAEIKKKNSRAARREAVGQMKKNVSQAPVQVKNEENGDSLRVKPKVLAAERLLLMLFAQDRAVYETWRHVVDEGYFQVPLHKSLAEAIKKEYETQKTIDLRNILNQFDAGLAGEISAVFASQSEYENNQNAARDAVETIELENIDGLIHKYAKENDIVKLNELLKRKAQINADERRA